MQQLNKANCGVHSSSANQIVVFGFSEISASDLTAMPLRFPFWPLDSSFSEYTDMPEHNPQQPLTYSDHKITTLEENGQTLCVLHRHIYQLEEEQKPAWSTRPVGTIILEPCNPGLSEDRRLISASGEL